MTGYGMDFHGAKLAILVGDEVVCLLRDNLDWLPYADHWDLPGGAREPGETPEETVLRELHEELGLIYAQDDLHWKTSHMAEDGRGWFFVSIQPDFDITQVVFGDEGQGWKLAPVAWFINEAKAVPTMQSRLAVYVKEHGCALPS